MALVQIFLVLVVLSSEVGALSWSNCDGSTPINVKEISLSPQPIPLAEGANIKFSGKFKLDGTTGTQYKLRLSLWKKAWFTWFPIPCPKCQQDVKCSEIAVFLRGATCPLPSKEYVVEEQSFHLSNLPGFITALVPEGDYCVKAELLDSGSNKPVACVEAYPQITKTKPSGEL
ncbi:unnamed protein product [Porites lobata]|uniref:MD-2-related lipid-recognition domain-containing protein n=1 Tax=Porites lobata TaxID=104759 RepID=A0ABN8P6P7_9CNID|nr:unnamed protein product [Porites lobata]